VSPWSDEGISATTFHVGAGLYLVAIAMISGAIGGYLAGRLRMKTIGLHDDEAYFRDTAHGLATWALATLLGATLLGAATTHILSGVATGAGASASAAAGTAAAANPVESYVDLLLRAEPGQGAPAPVGASNAQAPVRDELGRLFTPVLRKGGEISAADRTYAARVVAARTGLPQAEAERRVNDVIVQAKKTADDTRKATMKLLLWLAASMLAGATAAMLGAVEGGLLRDSKWYEPGWRSTVVRTH
jgi:hypothetical protein